MPDPGRLVLALLLVVVWAWSTVRRGRAGVRFYLAAIALIVLCFLVGLPPSGPEAVDPACEDVFRCAPDPDAEDRMVWLANAATALLALVVLGALGLVLSIVRAARREAST